MIKKIVSWFTGPQVALESALTSWAAEVQALRAENATLREQNKGLLHCKEWLDQQVDAMKQPQSFAFDFTAINVFSIERGFNSNKTITTTIGWLDSTGATREWYWYCNQETHERLVTDFIAFTQSKNPT